MIGWIQVLLRWVLTVRSPRRKPNAKRSTGISRAELLAKTYLNIFQSDRLTEFSDRG